MTLDRFDHGSVQDLPFALAQDRMADLRASAATMYPEPTVSRSAASPGIATRIRDAVGRRLIALGGSMVTDEALRRRALHL